MVKMQNKKYVCEVYNNTRSTNQSTFLNSFMPLVSFFTPRKQQITRGFLMFLGGIEKKQWHEMGL